MHGHFQYCFCGHLQFGEGEELLPKVFQRGAKVVNIVIDDEETVVIPMADIDGDGLRAEKDEDSDHPNNDGLPDGGRDGGEI